MKKFSLILLSLLIVLLFSGQKAQSADLLTYVSQNLTASRVDTAVSTSTIIPGKNWILGFRISPNNASTVDPTVELYDSATTGAMAAGNLFDALEANTSPLQSDGEWYPGGKKLSSGLAIRQGGYTNVIIFYERRIQ